ncbi:cell wall protein [Fusarium sp. NRRL 52700]|nr:cell wall protein [Fusarium sp. NRRL 52700]
MAQYFWPGANGPTLQPLKLSFPAALFDYKCICQDEDYLEQQICCLYKECTDGDREAAEGYARSVCQAVGVTLGHNLTCPTPSASASGTATEEARASTKTDTAGSSASLDSASGNNESGDENSKTHIAHQTSQHKIKTGLGAGLGAGIPILGAIVGAITWFLKRKKKQSAAQAPQTNTIAQPPFNPSAPPYEVQNVHPAPGAAFYPVPQAHPQNTGYSQQPVFEAYGSPVNVEGQDSATKIPATHELPVGRT